MIGPRFVREALAEYEDAVAWYEARQEGLGARLIDEVDEATSIALRFPDAAPFVRGIAAERGLRWLMLRSFQIKLVYTVRDEVLLVVAVFHAHRRPGYWTERLKSAHD